MDRHELIELLRGTITSWEHVRAAWLGGSDASGRTDERSDIDLVMIVEDDRVEDVFEEIETALASRSPIAHRYRLPSPTWHGHEQAFFMLERAGPDVLLDLVVMRLSAEDRFLERERHGDPIVLVDRDGLVVAPPLDQAALTERRETRRADLIARFPMFQSFVAKAVARNHPAEAMHWYRAMTLMPLVELLRMRYCPDRFDFGPRYLDRDLPPDLADAIARLSYAADMDTLLAHQKEAQAIFEREAVAD